MLQSGDDGLHESQSHRRKIADDYGAAAGGEIPSRITAVWFISAGSACYGTTADATFALSLQFV